MANSRNWLWSIPKSLFFSSVINLHYSHLYKRIRNLWIKPLKLVNTPILWDSSGLVSPFPRLVPGVPRKPVGASLSREHQLSALTRTTECFLNHSAVLHHDRAFTVLYLQEEVCALFICSFPFCISVHSVSPSSPHHLFDHCTPSSGWRPDRPKRVVNKWAGICLHWGS